MTEKEPIESLVNDAIRKTDEAVAKLTKKVKSGTALTQKEIVGIADLLIGVSKLKVLIVKKMRLDGATYGRIGKVIGMSSAGASLLINKDKYRKKEVANKLNAAQPRLTVKLVNYPESNGKRNWTALLTRVDELDGLVGTNGGITIARGELWNRVAYEAERTRFLIGERDTEPFILDYSDDIETPEQWSGETHGPALRKR